MRNHSQIESQNAKNIKDEDFLAGMSNESRELFKRVLFDAMDLEIRKIEEEAKNMEIPLSSKRHKKKMNRLFRERVGGSFLPFPEESNPHESV